MIQKPQLHSLLHRLIFSV